MADKKKKNILDTGVFRIILTCISFVITAAILILSSLTIIEISNSSYENAPKYLVWIFVTVALMSIVMFLRNRTKMNLIRCIFLAVFNIILGVVVLFAKSNPFLFSITAGLYCLTIVVSRVFSIIQKHTVRNIIFNALIILFAIFMCIGIVISPISDTEQVQNIILVECVFIAVVSFVEAASIAFSELKLKVLLKIIVNTFSLEILFGLLTMTVCFSLVFMKMEPDINTFPDALWYCFAIITTIGFGDFAAVTPVGRILSVILGFYGIIVIAVITSIVVNFYNETSGKHDKKEFKEIQNEEEKDKKGK